jgi:hypothetical protein
MSAVIAAKKPAGDGMVVHGVLLASICMQVDLQKSLAYFVGEIVGQFYQRAADFIPA